MLYFFSLKASWFQIFQLTFCVDMKWAIMYSMENNKKKDI